MFPVASLFLTGACGLGLEFVDSSLGFLVLACIVCAVTEMCISLFSSVAVEMFPTHLRYFIKFSRKMYL